jgi:predicted ferric reductase
MATQNNHRSSASVTLSRLRPDPQRTPTRGDRRRSHATRSTKLRRRPGHAPQPWIARVFVWLARLGFVGVVTLAITGETRGSLSGPGGWLIATGRLAGFIGTYLILIMLVLIARLPWLERAMGQPRLVKWHRQIGPWPIVLIAGHVTFITFGYAALAKTGFLRQVWVFFSTYPNLLAASVGFSLLVMAGVTSINIARRHLKYETWWAVHLYLYLALALAFAHQIGTGGSFVHHPATRFYWSALWASTAGVVVVFRVLQPIGRSLRHQLRVKEVRQESPDVFSLICTGRRLDRLAVSGGQFFTWRFLTRELWWHAHPYSLSALPQPPYLRVTIKGLGDQSRAVAALKPGTRIVIEGPYGAFTQHARTQDRVVLIGAGVGITPLRALLEDLPVHVKVSVIIRASNASDVVHRREIVALVERRGGEYHEVVGNRDEVRFDAQNLRQLVPEIERCDLYVCGPDGFSRGVIAAARSLGVRPNQIHDEAFAF